MQGIVNYNNLESVVTQLKERIQDLKNELLNNEKRIENLEKLLYER